nr:transposase [Leucothrix pacifica]
MLRQSFYEKALDAELDDHLGYHRHEAKQGTNSRNDYTKKTVKTDDGQLEINTPRDRQSEFESQIIKKRETRTPALDSKILSLYAKGMTTRSIVETLSEFYGGRRLSDVDLQFV